MEDCLCVLLNDSKIYKGRQGWETAIIEEGIIKKFDIKDQFGAEVAEKITY